MCCCACCWGPRLKGGISYEPVAADSIRPRQVAQTALAVCKEGVSRLMATVCHIMPKTGMVIAWPSWEVEDVTLLGS